MYALIGCGFLGSIVAEEIFKRQYALEDSTRWLFIDSDAFEGRNAANQNVDWVSANAGVDKATHLVKMASMYNVGAQGEVVRVERSNIDALLDDVSLVIDAVDNIPTRQEIWYWGKRRKVPVMHMGINQGGTGRVDWTYEGFDSWPLSPIAMLGQKPESKGEPKKLKPCELIAFRGLGVNMGIAGAKALGLWRGFDPESTVATPFPRILTTWEATMTGHTLTHVDERYT
jgi:hypothetical protein